VELLNDAGFHAGTEGMGLDEEQRILLLRRSATVFHEAYRKAKGKKYWADKTPTYVRCLPGLFRLMGSQAKWLFIFRHPMDVAYSIWKRGWNSGNQADFAEDPLGATCRYVAECAQLQLQLIRRLSTENGQIVYYDQWVEAPEPHLRKFCEWYGVPFSERMLAYADQPHDFGCEDPVVRGTAGFSPSHGNWKAWRLDEQARAWEILAEAAHALGFEQDDPRVRRPIHLGP
ncbi:sulfotransferase, partial [Candidatus Parcubacteria bacterium]